jgi:hypothetical protein
MGNWQPFKREDSDNIYKCSECDMKLRVNIRKKTVSQTEGIHYWFDQQHVRPFNEDIVSAGMHRSVKSFVKGKFYQNEEITSKQLMEAMKLKYRLLYEHF